MGIAKGGALRLLETFLYAIEFCCAGVILGIFSWFLAVLHDHGDHIPDWERAVEGISGAACLYLIFAVLLTCFLGGISVFAFLAIILDVCFIGGFIAIAILTRHGAHSCSGLVNTPLGIGLSNEERNGGWTTSYGYACRLNKAAFAVSIAGACLFLFTALLQIALLRNHQKEKRYGPSPANNYTSGSGNRKFWQRNQKTAPNDNLKNDAELGVIGAGAGGLAADHHNKNKYASDPMRPSHDTAYTGSTVAAPNSTPYARDTGLSAGVTDNPHHTQHGDAIMGGGLLNNPNPGAHGSYYNQPEGTGVNPYGYDNAAPKVGTATNY